MTWNPMSQREESATTPPSLADFLLARIAEDEEAARAVDGHDWSELGYTAPAYTLERVVAECEAKRRIVKLHSGDHVCVIENDDDQYFKLPESCPTLRLLALPYADHPDFRQEWRP